MSNQLQVSGEAKIRAIQGPVVANSGVITALDGDASEYVRGDGTLADFPTSTGGGSSVSYYLNTSVSQGTIGGVAYKQLSKTPISGAGTDVTISANGYIASYITDANDPALLEVPAGNFNCEFYFSVNSNSHNPYVYAELYKYDGTTFTLLGSNVSIPQYLNNGTTLSPYYFAIAVSTAVLTVTDRIAIRIYVNVDGRTVTLHTENNHLCQVVTTFSKGLISLNNLTRQNQFFQTGTSGTDFAISSATATHTFNLPVASATNTGKLSSTDWSTFNGKVPYTGATANVDLGAFDLSADDVTLSSNLASLTRDVVNSIGILRLQKGANGYIQPSTLSVDRTYTLPDASGTIALTADLTGYVTLGTTQTITGVKTFTTSNLFSGANLFTTFSQRFDQGVAILETANFGPTAGYTTIVGAVDGYALRLSNNGKKIFLFASGTTNNTFTFPDATGTIALTSDLSSYVPYTGATASVNIGNNLLSSASIQLNGDNTSNFGYLGFKQYAGGSSGFNGYTSIFAQGTNSINIAFSATGGSKTISFLSDLISSSTTRSYSLPDADGTIALTSSLSSYLPLAGGTLTGALNGTSAVFSSTVQASAYRLTGMTGGSGALYWSSDRVTLANYNATGVVNIEANGGTSVATFGGATYNNDFVGTLRNTTSAYFATTSGSVGIGTTSVNASTILAVAGSNTATDARGILSVNTTNAYGADLGGSISLGGENGSGSTPYPFGKISGRKEGGGAAYSGYLSLATTFSDGTITERMRITSAGLVGIGSGASGNPAAYGFFAVSNVITVNTLTGVAAGFSDNTYGTTRLYIQNGINGINVDQAFAISTGGGGSEATNGFNVTANGTIVNNSSGDAGMYLAKRSGFSASGFILFYVAGTQVGSITTNGSATSYNPSSDRRLKENIKPIKNAIDKVMKLKPVTYNWINTGISDDGFIAQDLLELDDFKYRVNGIGKGEDGTEYYGVDYMRFVSILTAAIQEQQILIQNLQEQINILAK